jgi:hypothetical protein
VILAKYIMRRGHLKEIVRLVEEKKVKTVIDSVWGFDEEGIMGAYKETYERSCCRESCNKRFVII